jgi:LacI family transcriptional regulator
LKNNRANALRDKPKMYDVAQLANVSLMTVSRVLNGAAHVSPQTTQRVQSAIKQLKYHPNELARAFRGQQTKVIGLILPYLYDPFFATCAHAVTTVAKEHGYSVLMTTSNESPDIEYLEAEQMIQRNIEGMLVIPAGAKTSKLTRSMFGKLPVVVFDRPLSGHSFDTVTVQNHLGVKKIVQHLIEHGHRNICFMGLSKKLYTINARYLGYCHAMQEAALDKDDFQGCDSLEATISTIANKLKSKNPPTAFFASNNLATRNVLVALQHLKIRIPDEIAFAGFDDSDLAQFTTPSLTVVRQPEQKLGSTAVRLLFDRIINKQSLATAHTVILPVEIVLRHSCGCKDESTFIVS